MLSRLQGRRDARSDRVARCYDREVISPSTLPARVFRAALVGWTVAALAVVAHVVADGMAPPALAVILVSLVATCASLALSRSRLTPLVLMVLIGSAQVAVHLLGTYLAGPAHHLASAVDSQLMFVAHAVSTVAAALLLAHGERVWWLLVAWIGGWHAVVLRSRPRMRLLRLFTQWCTACAAADLRYCVGLRGPPALTQL